MAVEPIKYLELHFKMIQFLIKPYISAKNCFEQKMEILSNFWNYHLIIAQIVWNVSRLLPLNRALNELKKMVYSYQTFVQIKAKRVCKNMEIQSGSKRSKARHALALSQVAFLAFCVTSASGQNL